MVHIPARFRENTAMRFRVTVRQLNMTDRQMDRWTDGGGGGGGGVSISPIPGLWRGEGEKGYIHHMVRWPYLLPQTYVVTPVRGHYGDQATVYNDVPIRYHRPRIISCHWMCTWNKGQYALKYIYWLHIAGLYPFLCDKLHVVWFFMWDWYYTTSSTCHLSRLRREWDSERIVRKSITHEKTIQNACFCIIILQSTSIMYSNIKCINKIQTIFNKCIKHYISNTLRTRRHSVERIHSPCHKSPLSP